MYIYLTLLHAQGKCIPMYFTVLGGIHTLKHWKYCRITMEIQVHN